MLIIFELESSTSLLKYKFSGMQLLLPQNVMTFPAQDFLLLSSTYSNYIFILFNSTSMKPNVCHLVRKTFFFNDVFMKLYSKSITWGYNFSSRTVYFKMYHDLFDFCIFSGLLITSTRKSCCHSFLCTLSTLACCFCCQVLYQLQWCDWKIECTISWNEFFGKKVT